jgi:hypothetical protein
MLRIALGERVVTLMSARIFAFQEKARAIGEMRG